MKLMLVYRKKMVKVKVKEKAKVKMVMNTVQVEKYVGMKENESF